MFDENIRLLESEFAVQVVNRGGEIVISGEPENVMLAEKAVQALLTLFPLDDFVEAPLAVMQVPAGMFPGDKAPIWEAFRAAADTDLPTAKFDMMAHDAFMERAKKAFAVVQTGETALYGNIIIRKGVVRA